jgi:hypothetical protein
MPTRRPRSDQLAGADASRHIDQRIRDLDGWRGATLSRLRALIRAADPEIVEEVKWMGTPVWSRGGIVCTGETYAKAVKLTFPNGAALPDPARLFNASLDGNARRAIDVAEGARVDADAFTALVRAAVLHNEARASTRKTPTKRAAAKRKAPAAGKAEATRPARPIAKAKSRRR